MQMAYYHLNKIEQKAALKKSLSSVFNVPSKRLAEDYRLISQQVDALIDEDSGLCPGLRFRLREIHAFLRKALRTLSDGFGTYLSMQ